MVYHFSAWEIVGIDDQDDPIEGEKTNTNKKTTKKTVAMRNASDQLTTVCQSPLLNKSIINYRKFWNVHNI